MVNFATKPYEEFDTVMPISKLVREGKILIDEFLNEIKNDNNLKPELLDLIAILTDVADRKEPKPPPTKNKFLKGFNKFKYKPLEAKSKHLRLYYIFKDGIIVLIGGKKTEQVEDIERIKKIIKEYSALK